MKSLRRQTSGLNFRKVYKWLNRYLAKGEAGPTTATSMTHRATYCIRTSGTFLVFNALVVA